MQNILLLSEDTLKTYSNLSDNAYGKWILPAIREAQEMSLMPIIGECLYNKVCELVGNGLIDNDLYAAYKDLLDGRIQPFLVYQTLTNIVPIINGKMANIGTVATNDEHIITLSQGELDLTQNYYRERADFYAKRLQDWVKNNREAFPELECMCSTKPNLERSNNSVGMWLGGARGKKVADRSCGCGTSAKSNGSYQEGFMDGYNEGLQSGYTSGHTDGYNEGLEECGSESYDEGVRDGEDAQKAKLAVTAFTENGRYTRADGWSEVTVDVESDWREAYDAGYNQGQSKGHDEGVAEQKSKLSSNTFTQNGTYTRTDGWSAVTVNVEGSGTSANLQRKSVTVTADTQSVTPDTGFDGMSAVTVDATIFGRNKYIEGFLSADDDSTMFTVASAVTLNEYGVYKFVFNENTNVSAMTVTFSGVTGDTGTTKPAYVYLFNGIVESGKYLWNPNADTSKITQVILGGEPYTGGALYTGETISTVESNGLYIYLSDGILPENFFSVDNLVEFKSCDLYHMKRIKGHAIYNTPFKWLTANGEMTFETNSVTNNSLLEEITFIHTYTYTMNSAAIVNNPNLHIIKAESNGGAIISDAENLFYGSRNNGVLIYQSNSEILGTSWWSYLQSIGWEAIYY